MSGPDWMAVLEELREEVNAQLVNAMREASNWTVRLRSLELRLAAIDRALDAESKK